MNNSGDDACGTIHKQICHGPLARFSGLDDNLIGEATYGTGLVITDSRYGRMNEEKTTTCTVLQQLV
jgi:hypothetical protein